MNEAIENTKKNIKVQILNNNVFMSGESFSKYQKVYFNTNENIKGYLENITDKNNALTVLASGEHALNLMNKNILNIDTFDCNALTEYYVFGIKFAMIQKYTYKEYLNILSILIGKNTSLELITSIINDLLPHMDNKYRMFWSTINEYNYRLQKENNTNINLFHLITLGIDKLSDIVLRNNYLTNEEEYNKLKNNLCKTNITFKNIDAINLKKEYNEKYDLILMSNIFDYMYKKYGPMFKYKDIKKYIDSLESMLDKDGILFLNYIYNYCSKSFAKTHVIEFSEIKKGDIKKTEIITINSFKGYEKLNDGMLLIKK